MDHSTARDERIRVLVGAFEMGMENDAIAYHSTSLEAVQKMVETGYLPPSVTQ